MKAADGYNKLRGGYYTPVDIARFIVDWAVRSGEEQILEPSCGDGSFLGAIRGKLQAAGRKAEQIRSQVMGIELDKDEAAKAAAWETTVVNEDFFTYYKSDIEGKKKFDVIVGNPPFIRYQNFNEEYRTIAFALLKEHGFHPNRLTNIWLPFLVLSAKALKENGRIGMVIPAELFQVDYAAEARLFLSEYFESLTLITFKRLIFEDIQQEVVLLLGEKSYGRKGIRVVELESLEELANRGLSCLMDAEVKVLDHSREKWVKYYLTNEELKLLNRLNHDERITGVEELYEVNVGLVSGENDFFLTNKDTVCRYGLEADTTPVISRAEQVRGILLMEEDYVNLANMGKRVYIFTPGNEPLEQLSESARRYIEWGEGQGFDKNYKCRVRKRWYHVPQSWQADAFLIRQANLYPKMIVNCAGALVTDTLHKVRFREGVDGKAVASAFLNSYTLALSETLGRSYGGGVLTFEPGEMRRMRIPMAGASRLEPEKIDGLQRQGKYEEILDYTDSILLLEGLGLSREEAGMLRRIWEKMRNRRLSRKK